MISLKKIYADMMAQRDGRERFDCVLGEVDEYLAVLHTENKPLYEKLKMGIYVTVNGYHFDEEMLYKAFEGMENDDRTQVPKFDVPEATRLAQRAGVRFGTFNEYDWAYVMNMFYSDYCQIIGDQPEMYVKMSEKFLNDPDAPDRGATKALRYYLAMHPKK